MPLRKCYNHRHRPWDDEGITKSDFQEKNNMPSVVEPGESLPRRVMIDNMMAAGVNLQAIRSTRGFEFHPDAEIPENWIDPTRHPNFDITDAVPLQSEVKERLVEQQALFQESKKKQDAEDKKIEAYLRKQTEQTDPNKVDE